MTSCAGPNEKGENKQSGKRSELKSMPYITCEDSTSQIPCDNNVKSFDRRPLRRLRAYKRIVVSGTSSRPIVSTLRTHCCYSMSGLGFPGVRPKSQGRDSQNSSLIRSSCLMTTFNLLPVFLKDSPRTSPVRVSGDVVGDSSLSIVSIEALSCVSFLVHSRSLGAYCRVAQETRRAN